jgi:hypothetical protein
MKREYYEGPEATKRFEDSLASLFRVPKDAVKKPTKRERKEPKTGKD